MLLRKGTASRDQLPTKSQQPNTIKVKIDNGSVTVVPGPVAVFCMVYHYTKRATLTRLLGNVGPAIYVVL